MKKNIRHWSKRQNRPQVVTKTNKFHQSKLMLNAHAWEYQTVAHALPGQTMHWLTNLIACVPCSFFITQFIKTNFFTVIKNQLDATITVY